MAVRLRIQVLQPTIKDPLGRPFVGWFPGRSEAELWEGNRGLWKINRARLRHERFALVVYNDAVVAVGEITGWADHDDRVVPAHSFKFTAQMQHCQAGDAPILIRIESKAGHGAGKPTSKRIDEEADTYAFLFQNIGVPYKSVAK